MKQFVTQGIVLSRTNFGEADRIITFLTIDQGKVRAMAKGVRKQKSKLAGGIELFSISDLTLIIGRGEINTLISTRLLKHYGNIVKQVERTKAGYDLIKLINKNTEDAPEPAYFDLLKEAFEGLNDLKLDPQLTLLWAQMQLLRLAGHKPELHNDVAGNKLSASSSYTFHLERMHFAPKASKQGRFSASDIKFLRLGFQAERPHLLHRVDGATKLANVSQPLIQSMLKTFVRI